MPLKIVSGGQTGVDRAALDAAIELNIDHGGWCPKGRLAELEQTIPFSYQLTETSTCDYSERTKLNIRDSDGTLILVPSLPLNITDGTILTLEEVKRMKKPFLIIDLSLAENIDAIIEWINIERLIVINVAGPRESQSPGIYHIGNSFLKLLFGKIVEAEHISKFRI